MAALHRVMSDTLINAVVVHSVSLPSEATGRPFCAAFAHSHCSANIFSLVFRLCVWVGLCALWGIGHQSNLYSCLSLLGQAPEAPLELKKNVMAKDYRQDPFKTHPRLSETSLGTRLFGEGGGCSSVVSIVCRRANQRVSVCQFCHIYSWSHHTHLCLDLLSRADTS